MTITETGSFVTVTLSPYSFVFDRRGRLHTYNAPWRELAAWARRLAMQEGYFT